MGPPALQPQLFTSAGRKGRLPAAAVLAALLCTAARAEQPPWCSVSSRGGGECTAAVSQAAAAADRGEQRLAQLLGREALPVGALDLAQLHLQRLVAATRLEGLAASAALRRQPVEEPLLPTEAKHAKREESIKGLSAIDPADFGSLLTSLAALVIGTTQLVLGFEVSGLLMTYYGAQSGFNLYMKIVLSSTVVSKELGLEGFPAAFLHTTVQLVVSFLLLGAGILVASVGPWKYRLQTLKTREECLGILMYSLAWALNHGLNNFALSMIPISLNLILRSCTPLTTVAVEAALRCGGVTGALAGRQARPSELGFLVGGVVCAGLVTWTLGMNAESHPEEHITLGMWVALGSILSGSLNLVLCNLLATDYGFNPVDATFYTSMPAAVITALPSFLVAHPAWPGYGKMTDWQIFQRVRELSPATLVLVLGSGLFAVAYSILMYRLVKVMSASTTAFAGNFNKALTIAVSLTMGLETLPPGSWGVLMIAGLVGNVSCFMGYTACRTESSKGCAQEALDGIKQEVSGDSLYEGQDKTEDAGAKEARLPQK